MSNSPFPVPSKAAIRVLRGLVFGTSCTLVLVTEDRRRRISAARQAIRNADRIRSAKGYHAGGSAFAVALEEEAFAEPTVIRWKPHDESAAAKLQHHGWPSSNLQACIRRLLSIVAQAQ